MRTHALVLGFAAALMIAGCGTNQGDRAASGAAIGAVGGAVVGAATNPCDLNLGDPFWRDNGGRDGYSRRCGHEYRDRNDRDYRDRR
jgi:hypothetical protein